MQSPGPLFRSCSKAKSENRPMMLDDLPALPAGENAAASVPELEKLWHTEITRCKETGEKPSLLRVILHGYTKELFLGAFFRLLADGGNIALALILREYVLWLNSDKDAYIGVIFAFALMLSNFTANACLSLSNEMTMSVFQRIRTGATCLVFNKSLRIPADHGAHGEVVAMHSTDTAKFRELQFIHGMVVGPITLVGNMVALYILVGPLAFLALGLLFVIMFLQAFVSSKTGGAIHEAHGHADSRLKAIAEVVQGIRICKLMNWEDKFAARIEQFRQLEVVALRRLYRYRTIISGLAHSVHMILLLGVFLVAWATDEPIKPENVFPAMALMGTLRHVINGMTMGLGKFLDIRVSCNRLADYYLRSEKEDYVDVVAQEDLGANSLEIKDTDIGYVDAKGEFQPIMSKVNAAIPEGKLTLVVGPTGGGKSTLMGAMNGEARVGERASIRRTRDSVAFVPQEAWIMNDTVRGNIIMGSGADDDDYQRAVVACQLVDDFEQLQDGDDTEIGERGINLSGGQKQRIAFARAVCSGRDIVLMDDPLSAVDSHVCRALFEDCICGALDGRTRVLVTHQVQFLPFADSIIVVKDRSVVFQGTYEELLQSPHSENLGAQTAPGGRASGPASARNGGTPNNREKPPALSMASPVGGANASPKERKLISEEMQESGGIAAGVYSWYLLLAGKANIVMCLLFFLVWRIALMSVDIWLSLWATRSGGFGKDSYTDEEYATWFGISAAAGLCFIFVRQYFFDKSVGDIAAKVHGSMVDRLIRCPVSFFDTTPQGRIMNRFSKDLRVMDFVVSEFAIFTITLIVLAAGYIVIIAVSSVYMIPLVVVMGLIYYRMTTWYTYALRAIKRLENVERSPMMAIMSEILGGLPTIRAYGLHDRLIKTHADRVDGMMRALHAGRIAQFNVMLILSVTGSSILLILALLAVLMERNDTAGTVSPGPTYLALGVTYAATLTMVFGFLMILAAEVDASMSAAERMKEYATSIEQEQDVVYGSAPDQCSAPDPKWPASGSIEFDDVQLRYRPGLPLVLKGISLELRSGEKVGIVGRTGSGKSTIMLALFRIIELAQGSIRLDGRDISTLKLADLRSNITIIPQDPTLFQGTVRSNLDPFNNFDDEEVWGVLGKVGLKQRVESNGKGLEDPVDDKGTNFSVGQRQLLCLARALLKRTRILLLDEATASVDFEVDGLIQRTIRDEFSSCTVLTIAHRLATIIDSDRVLVLNEGSVAEFDAPATLLDNMNGQFFSMVSNLGEEQYLQLYEAAQAALRSKKK